MTRKLINIRLIAINFFIALLALHCTNTDNKVEMIANKEKGNLKNPITATNAPNLFIEINGKKLAYRSIGEGEPIILCQRFRGNMDNWDPAFLDALARQYKVVIFDYTGFGLSTGPVPTTVLEFAEDVRDLAKALQYEKVIVGGWSLGGWVAQIVTTEFPEIVSQTIVIGAKPPGVNKYEIEPIFMETAFKPSYSLEDETILFFEPASALSKDSAKVSHDRIAARTIDHDIRIKEELWPYYQKCGDDFAADPYKAREKLSKIKTPMLVISADHEVCFPPENWFALNRQLPNTQLIVIPQSGHGVQHQYPELVSNYIIAFLKNNS
jgi:pimeloyl-ACP methyl ester carboxylesterase